MLEISWLAIALTIAAASTPLLLAAAGELVVERAGVLNLGLEGMMLMGAVIGFIVKVESGSWFVACLAAACVGALFSQAFAFFVLTLRANQVAAGLALTILGGGLAAVLGAGYVGVSLAPMPRIPVVGSELHPWLGLLEHSPAVLVGASGCRGGCSGFYFIAERVWFCGLSGIAMIQPMPWAIRC